MKLAFSGTMNRRVAYHPMVIKAYSQMEMSGKDKIKSVNMESCHSSSSLKPQAAAKLQLYFCIFHISSIGHYSGTLAFIVSQYLRRSSNAGLLFRAIP